MIRSILISAALPLCASAAVMAKEPAVMKIAGEEVPASEFLYLYNKNNQQQLVPQSIDDYVEMFKIYKMKVADAKSLGIDTTESFKKEMAQYRRELAAPYIADSAFINSMIDQAFEHSGEEVEVSFIKVPKSRMPQENQRNKALADTLVVQLRNGADFAQIAKAFSQDVAADQGGYHGFMTFGRLPYNFEEALYSTRQGEISDVIELSDGYYILKPGQRRPSRGKVEAAHILKLTNMLPENERAQRKQQIDSIYALLKENPQRFGELAKSFSDDKMSARQEGKLPAFGSGEMLPEFEQVAFSLGVGEISEPFESRYGWHIIKKSGEMAPPTKDEVKEMVSQKMNNPQDERYRVIKEREMSALVAKHKGELNEELIKRMKTDASAAGIDSLYLANWTTIPNASLKAGTVGGKTVTPSDILSPLKNSKDVPAEMAEQVIDRLASRALEMAALEAEEELLYQTETDYRNLLDEYTDGSLLYEVSLMKVWDKGSKDEEGLNNYFNQHRADFKWKSPHAKGVLVQSLNDSVSNLVRQRLEVMPVNLETLSTLRKEFSGKAVMDIVVVEEGVNPMVDNIMFGGPAAKTKFLNFTDYFMFNPRLIEAPEEMSDVRADVATAYQNELEQEWIKELKAKYPVKVNKKVIEKLK